MRLATQSARCLSEAQAQQVARARSLAVRPELPILDEPPAHLDPAPDGPVARALAEDTRLRGTTLIWATHNLCQARRVAHRVGLLLDGDLVEEAATEAFFDHPADPRTAAFVRGEMIY